MGMTHRATKVSLVTVFLAVLAMFVAWSLAGTKARRNATSVARNSRLRATRHVLTTATSSSSTGGSAVLGRHDDGRLVHGTFNAADVG